MKRIVNALGKLNRWKRAHAVFVLCAATAVFLPAQTLTTLYSFCSQSGCTDGAFPWGGLVKAADGDLYGTTTAGGANCEVPPSDGCGTVFKITPSGTLTTLYSFCAQSGCTDGAFPEGGLVQGLDGNFYGTTQSFGASGVSGGTVFKIAPSGELTTLYSFCSQSACTDGRHPQAGLVQATNGDLYGTTAFGGANCEVPTSDGCGTIFKITPSGTLTTLYSFCAQSSCTDGAGPAAGLVQGTDGNLYGTTQFGGVPPVNLPENTCIDTGGCGTIFKITPSGTLTTVYAFCPNGASCAGGYSPAAALVQGTDGNFYGTTPYPTGTVFQVTPSGTLTTLYSFCSQINAYGTCADGLGPMATLAQGTDGNFYGTTDFTIFRITPSGMLTTLINFCPDECGGYLTGPSALIQAANGEFYGTTSVGGVNLPGCADGYGCGTVFSLSVGLGPSVPAVNTGGVLNSASYTTQGVAPGSIVSIFGTNLAASTAAASAVPLPTALSDVTSVALNGIPAGLYFVSQNQINAQLPFNVLPGQSSGTASIVVTRSSGASTAQSVTVVPASPGIFTTTANGSGQAFAYDNATGALAAPAGAPIGPFATAPISVSSGDALIIACTGLGAVNPSIDNYVAASDGILRYTVLTPTVLIGGVAATPVYSVLSPQFVSEYQIGVIPAPTTPTGDAVSIQIEIGGVTTTDQVTIAVAQ
jgi:uncharacterized protein (TIGR03437 family)